MSPSTTTVYATKCAGCPLSLSLLWPVQTQRLRLRKTERGSWKQSPWWTQIDGQNGGTESTWWRVSCSYAVLCSAGFHAPSQRRLPETLLLGLLAKQHSAAQCARRYGLDSPVRQVAELVFSSAKSLKIARGLKRFRKNTKKSILHVVNMLLLKYTSMK